MLQVLKISLNYKKPTFRNGMGRMQFQKCKSRHLLRKSSWQNYIQSCFEEKLDFLTEMPLYYKNPLPVPQERCSAVGESPFSVHGVPNTKSAAVRTGGNGSRFRSRVDRANADTQAKPNCSNPRCSRNKPTGSSRFRGVTRQVDKNSAFHILIF